MTNKLQNIEFPTLVYRGKGPHFRAGGTYDYTEVKGQEDFDAKLSAGWFATLPSAIEANDNPQIVDDSPPTREELETKAKELGIKFYKKTTNDDLNSLIISAIKKE